MKGVSTIVGAMRPRIGTACRVIVGAVFVWAALSKLLLLTAAEIQQSVVTLLPLPGSLAFAVAWGVPWLELALGIALLVGRPRRTAAWAAVALLAVFTLLLVRAAWTGAAPEGCLCFGPQTSGSIHLDVARNLLLVALAARAAA